MEYVVPEIAVFDADYKGTCALCWGAVRPGQKLVRIMVEACGDKFPRNVHRHCQELLCESTPDPAMVREFQEAVITP